MFSVIDSKKVDDQQRASGRVKVGRPSPLDLIRMVLLGLTFTISCTYLVLFSPLKHLTLPLQRLAGLHPKYSPLAWVAWFVSRTILMAGGIWWTCTSDKSGDPPRAIYMYNHGSNLDPPVVYGYLGFCRQLYKKSLEGFPPLKWAMRTWGYVAVVRENRELAIAAINDKFAVLLNEGHSAALSPEGTRTMTGDLQPFKKGGFHLAVNTKTPIVPVIISGNYDLWAPSLAFAKVGNVKLRLLEPIYPREGQSVDDLLEEVRAVFASSPQEPVDPPSFRNYASMLFFAALYSYVPYRIICALFF